VPRTCGLGADVLRRVAGSDDEDVLAGELHGIPEVVCVEDAAQELLEARVVRNVGDREVAGCHHHEVELLGRGLVVHQVVAGDGELPGCIVERDASHSGAEPDEPPHVALLDAALDVVPEDLPRGIGGDGLSEVFLESVVGELEAFLGAVGPQVPVHGPVDRLAVLVHPRAPRVVPEASPVVLLLVADDFGDLGAAGFG